MGADQGDWVCKLELYSKTNVEEQGRLFVEKLASHDKLDLGKFSA